MSGVHLRLLLGFCAAGLLGLGAVVALPGGGGDNPPAGTLVAVASVLALVTGIALYAGLHWELELPVSIALFAVGYNVLVVLVKFVIGPQALYDASDEGKVTTDLGDQGMATITALGLGAAYLLAFWVLYRLARRQLEGNATLLVTVFWIGAAYLALYHALWVVYILVLTSIWPLKVVSSK